MPEWLTNGGIMTVGYYARVIFGGKKFSIKQLIALFLVGIAGVAIMNEINIATVYKLSIMLVAGMSLPNIIQLVIKTAEKTEEPGSDSLSKKIKKYLD